MPKFAYKAVSLTGGSLDGVYSAPDEGGVIAMLRQEGYYPVAIKKKSDRESKATTKKLKIKPMAGFCSQMAAMLRAGVPIAKTLEILKDQTEDRTLKLVLEDVYQSVHKGLDLSESFRPYASQFPAIFLNMVEAGEASGMLDACLERAGSSFARTAKLNAKIKGASIYPSVILTVLLGLLILTFTFLIPSFATMYDAQGADLPGFTLVLLGISNFMVQRWYIVLLFIAAVFALTQIVLRTDRGRTAFDRFLFRAPAVSKLLKKVYAARFARTLSALYSAGVSLPQSLRVTARSVINRYMEKEIYKIVDAVNRGEELSAPLERMALLPPMIIYMTRLGEESGALDDLLTQAADYYDEESDFAVQAFMSMLEPGLIILMAAVVVPVLLGVLMPMFNMYDLMLV